MTLNKLFGNLTKEKFTLHEVNFGGAAKIGMIVLTEEPLPCRKPKKEWKFNCKS